MTKKCSVFFCAYAATLLWVGVVCADGLPRGSAPAALAFDHFSDRLHAFVWRNWELASLERMASVLDTTPANVRDIGRSMGLPPHVRPPAEYQQRGYISIIRRNWHILPYEQLLTLLDWEAGKLAFALREDDFLWIKLGSLKPSCPMLRYADPDASAAKRCAEIKTLVSAHFGTELARPSRPRFDFFRDMPPAKEPLPVNRATESNERPIRFLYSYSGVFGDPLLDPQLDPYPDVLLRRLSELGVNGVWLHVVLRQLALSSIFPEFGTGHETRIDNLRKMVARAKQYGVNVYLYMNEPRAMPASFFEGREHLKGVPEGDHFALCTSTPEVRQWMKESLHYVFAQVPGLDGVFTITASENLTNCYSHRRDAAGCPRCSERTGPDVIAEVNRTIAAGVWAGNPKAKVIAWDWGWPDGTGAGWGKPDWASQIIKALPDNVYLMSVSEWGKPIVRGGVAATVGEYSISAVGPGPRALRHWTLAQERGLRTIAKVQMNCSWELSAVPYIPVMDLVAQHCENLAKTGVDGLMLSWTVGGYPSPNLELAGKFQRHPPPSRQQALTELAQTRYGGDAAEDVLAAWSKFSQAFSEYPFDIRYVYRGPTQYGPANLLYPKPTGYHATMIGFPYDDVESWRGVYPPDVLARQFEKMAAGWCEGLSAFEKASGKTGKSRERANARRDLGVAEAVALHFDSVANQIRFVLARDALLSGSLSPSERKTQIDALKAIATDEMKNAMRLFTLTREDPRIGFEASNQYYYLPLDLVEKVINCEYVATVWLPRQSPKGTRNSQ